MSVNAIERFGDRKKPNEIPPQRGSASPTPPGEPLILAPLDLDH